MRIFAIAMLVPTLTWAVTDLKKTLTCYTTLLDKLPPIEKAHIKKNGMIALDGKYDSDSGFYLYGTEYSYFCKLPAKPSNTIGKQNYYYMRLKVDGKVSYATYSTATGKDEPAIYVTMEPLPGIQNRDGDEYVEVSCPTTTNNQSEKTFHDHLRKIINSFYMEASRNANLTKSPASKKLIFDKYKEALSACESVPALASDVKSQKLLFEPPVDPKAKVPAKPAPAAGSVR